MSLTKDRNQIELLGAINGIARPNVAAASLNK